MLRNVALTTGSSLTRALFLVSSVPENSLKVVLLQQGLNANEFTDYHMKNHFINLSKVLFSMNSWKTGKYTPQN